MGAQRLQEEEDLMANRARRSSLNRASGAPRYRNANFVGFGSMNGDEAVYSSEHHLERSPFRRLSATESVHRRPFYPEHSESAEEGNGLSASRHYGVFDSNSQRRRMMFGSQGDEDEDDLIALQMMSGHHARNHVIRDWMIWWENMEWLWVNGRN